MPEAGPTSPSAVCATPTRSPAPCGGFAAPGARLVAGVALPVEVATAPAEIGCRTTVHAYPCVANGWAGHDSRKLGLTRRRRGPGGRQKRQAPAWGCCFCLIGRGPGLDRKR